LTIDNVTHFLVRNEYSLPIISASKNVVSFKYFSANPSIDKYPENVELARSTCLKTSQNNVK